MNNNTTTPFRKVIKFWLYEEDTQHFGDFLTSYSMETLFLRVPRLPGDIRIIGSGLYDYFVELAEQRLTTTEGPQRATLIAWGMGLRDTGSLSADRRKAVELLAVRGPLSASDLRLGDNFPIGDPGILRPALYVPVPNPRFSKRTVLVPHYRIPPPKAAL